MHLLSTRPGGFVEDESIVTRLEQTPADIVILSSADTTLALLAQACAAIHALQPDFPSVRLVNLLHLRQPASLDLYVDEVLGHAKVVVVDHLGSESAWPYGVQQISALAHQKRQHLAMFSGDLQEDLRLLEHFTHRLEALPAPQPLQHVVAGGGFAPASYRLSLLALLADGAEAGPEDGPVGSFMRLPVDVEFGDTLAPVGADEIAAITLGEVRPRTQPSAT